MNQLQDLMDYTFVSKYAQHRKEDKRRETYKEAIGRNRSMMLEKYKDFGIESEINFAYDAVEDGLCVGSQRALQFAGPAILKKHARIYNCSGTYCNRPEVFKETMFLLLAGTGCGLSVQKHHVNCLPEFRKAPKTQDVVFTIQDSIEGWADSIDALINCYFSTDSQWEGTRVRFVYDQIRPEGSEFSHGVGKAPGPDPLERAHKKIVALLEACLERGQTRLRPVDAYDILMHIANAVLAGGIRRSALIIIFSHDDVEMMNAKTGNWFKDNPQRARSNNSALLLRGVVTKEEFTTIFNACKQFGEPGFFWANSTEVMCNPCLEIIFYCYDTTVEGWKETPEYSGWQCCNLTSNNGGKIKTIQDFIRAVTASTIIGTLQAGFTDFAYLGKRTENIVRREALLGVSITGMMENPKILLDPKNQRDMAELAKKVNKVLADKIGINPAARITCIKPEGSTSSMLGTTSGIHPQHSKRFIRRVQTNKTEGPLVFYKGLNPYAVEESVWSESKSDDVVAFACISKDGTLFKKDMGAIKFLDMVKSSQVNWVNHGRNIDLCTKPYLQHNVSNTTVVKPEEWDIVRDYIFDNQEYFTGISLLSSSGDNDYDQAPFTEVLTLEEIIDKYGDGALFTSGLIEDAFRLWGNLWRACNAALGMEDFTIVHQNSYNEARMAEKVGWTKRLEKFAKTYIKKGDIKTATYLLKDIYNYKFFLDLQKKHKKVDYTKMVEENNTTMGTKELACAGGACSI